MTLREWLFRKNMMIKELAEKLECNASYLGTIIRKENIAGKHLAREIERITEGQVTIQELRGQ